MSGFWTNQGHEYVSGSEYARFLNKPGSWVSQVSEYTKVLNTRLVLNLPGFWMYLNMPDMSEYAGIWVNMPKFAWIAFVLYFPI